MTAAHPARALEAAGLARPVADASFDRIARLVQRQLGVPTALVTIVLPDAQVYPGALGLPDPFQATRRTTLTLLHERGIPIEVASKLVGHSSYAITADIYTHVMRKGANGVLSPLDR